MLRSHTLLFASAFAALTLSPAHAQLTVYTDRAAFNANAPGLTPFNFNGYYTKGNDSVPLNTFTLQGVTFTDADPRIVIGLRGYSATGGSAFDSAFLTNTGDNRPLVITPPSGTTEFGLDLTGYYDNYLPTFLVRVAGLGFEETFPVSAPANLPYGSTNSPGFVGFTSAEPITTVSIADKSFTYVQYSNSAGVDVDNITVGYAAPIPETSTVFSFGLLLALSLGGLTVTACRKSAKSTDRLP